MVIQVIIHNVYLLIQLRGVPPDKEAQTQMHVREIGVGRDEVGIVLQNVTDQLGIWFPSSPGLHYRLQEVVKGNLHHPFSLPLTLHPRSPIDER